MSLKVFYCYAHEDKMLRSILEKDAIPKVGSSALPVL